MKILLSWISFNNDMAEDEITGRRSGPTLQLLRSDSFDVLHLFSSNDEGGEIANMLKLLVNNDKELFEKGVKDVQEFNAVEVKLETLPLENPTDYKKLWEKLPEKVNKILKRYKNEENEIFINLSAGTPAMTSTWMMMVGTGQLKATLYSPQRDRNTKEEYINTVDPGIYPFVREIKNMAYQQKKTNVYIYNIRRCVWLWSSI